MGGRYTSRRAGKAWKPSAKSRAGWVLYLMIHFPMIWFVKIGITGRTATARAADIDEAVFGFPIPVFVLIVPEAYFFEQMLHSLCAPLNVRFYRGDGSSEWFFILAAVPALLFMLAGWMFYAWLIELATGLPATGFLTDLLTIIFMWAVELLKQF